MEDKGASAEVLSANDLTTHVYFVNENDCNMDLKGTMLWRAFTSFQETRVKELRSRWIQAEDLQLHLTALECRNSGGVVFVCEEFRGCVFELLRKNSCRVIGPDCVSSQPAWKTINCSRLSSLPLYTTILNNVKICCSGLSAELQAKTHEQVLLMGGSFSRSLDASVTHLVTHKVASPKYFAAIQHGICVVNLDWIDEVWEQGKRSYTGRSQFLELISAQHSLRPFEGLVISISQPLYEESVGVYKRVVETGGGIYCIQGNNPIVTHLVCDERGTSEVEMVENVTLVTPQWLFTCAKEGKCHDWKTLPSSSAIIPKSLVSETSGSHSPSRVTSSPRHPLSVQSGRKPDQIQETTVKYPDLIPETSHHPPVALPSKVPEIASPLLAQQISTSDHLSDPFNPAENSRPQESSSSANQGMPILERSFSEPVVIPGFPRCLTPTMSRAKSAAVISSRRSSVLTGNLARKVLELQPDEDFSSPVAEATAHKVSGGLRPRLSLCSPWFSTMEQTVQEPLVVWDENFGNQPFSSSPLNGNYQRFSTTFGGYDNPIDLRDGIVPGTDSEMRDPKSFLFMISQTINGKVGASSETSVVKKEFQEHISSLGAMYLTDPHYLPECTHLICPRPYLTEKFLASCAAGKWIIHPKYITDCVKAGGLLPEETYEWGNCKAGRLMVPLSDMELKWATTVHWWRKRIAETGNLAFSDWKVILPPNMDRREGYIRLLKAGGATIIPFDQPHSYVNYVLHDLEPDALAEFRDTLTNCTAPSHRKDFIDQFLLNQAHPTSLSPSSQTDSAVKFSKRPYPSTETHSPSENASAELLSVSNKKFCAAAL